MKRIFLDWKEMQRSFIQSPFQLEGQGAPFPPTDVYETETEYIVVMEIGGMKKRDFKISFSEGLLTICGERARNEPKVRYLQLEISYGEFKRQIFFKAPVDQKGIKASYTDGFLKVMLPKR